MSKHGTASQLSVDGAYIEFQLAVLRALPRDIETDVADGWRGNGEALAKTLREVLIPSAPQEESWRSRVRIVEFEVELDYDQTLENKGKSGFNYFNPNLTNANFTKVVGKGKILVKATAVCFGEYLESDQAVRRLDILGYRPGIPKELADLSKGLPNSQVLAGCLPLAALGDSWLAPARSRLVAFLNGDASYRRLCLYLWAVRWLDHWWFLAFHK